MKLKSIALLVSSLLLTSAVISTEALAKRHGDHAEHQAVRIMASEEEGVNIVVKSNGEMSNYSFELDELENIENIEAQLGELDDEQREKVVHLLSQLKEHDAKLIVLKDAEIEFEDDTTEIFVIKTDDEEGNVHIEIDAEGEGVDMHSPFLIKKLLGKGEGDHRIFHHRMKGKDGKHLAKVIKRMIKKAELSEEDLNEIRALLDEK